MAFTKTEWDATDKSCFKLGSNSNILSEHVDTIYGDLTSLDQAISECGLGTSGDTAGRPTVTFMGYMYFDTDLGLPIWWDGTGWVNATGTDADA